MLTTNVYFPAVRQPSTRLAKTIPHPQLIFLFLGTYVHVQVLQDQVGVQIVLNGDFEERVGGKSRIISHGHVRCGMNEDVAGNKIHGLAIVEMSLTKIALIYTILRSGCATVAR
jgi:hypothetical protein